MTKKLPRNTDQELLERAGRLVKEFPGVDINVDNVEIMYSVAMTPASQEIAWYKSRGLPIPECYEDLCID